MTGGEGSKGKGREGKGGRREKGMGVGCAARRRQVSCMPPRWQKTGLDIGTTGCFNANVFFSC